MAIEVPRCRFEIADPWRVPRECVPADLVSALDGSPPRLPTRCFAYHDGVQLYVLFFGADAETKATYTRRNDPLWEEDAVEIFVSPADPARYFEFEVSPLGTLFDASVDSPGGTREGMRVDASWDCEGLWAAVRRVVRPLDERRWDTLVAIPFAGIVKAPPSAGEVWRGNLYRIDRGTPDEFTAWRPTLRNPPDFHVTAAFGEMRFA